MSLDIKTIGVLTSGGDAPGMNAAIRAVVRTAIYKGMRVVGIKRGFNGLIFNDLREMNLRSVSNIIQTGGTVLYTARCLEFKTEQGLQRAKQVCTDNGIDGVVVIGGDGSLRGAADLSALGVPCVGIPGTIDNDIPCSDYSIGYDTALNTAMEMVDKLRDTAQSHDRCSVVEVMGNKSGNIAINTALAVGAVATLIPEKPYDLDKDVVDRMLYTQRTGKHHFIIVVAEGAGKALEIANYIQERTGIDTRATTLGHVQRGGSPTVKDRVVASRLGYRAVELLASDIGNRVVAIKHEQVMDFDITEALSMKPAANNELITISNVLSL